MMVYQEKIAPPGPLPDHTEPADVLLFQRPIESVEQVPMAIHRAQTRIDRELTATCNTER
jgi:hypothetical protein